MSPIAFICILRYVIQQIGFIMFYFFTYNIQNFIVYFISNFSITFIFFFDKSRYSLNEIGMP